nr:DUF488 family protein [Variovorax sp. SRS16]
MLTTLLTRLSGPPPSVRALPHGRSRRTLAVKSARENPAVDDGMRVLVDRHWPRGLAREGLITDLWLKEVAPSTRLQSWYGSDPSRWPAFSLRYRAEIQLHEDLLDLLVELRTRGQLTLLCDASDILHSHCVVLRDTIIERRFSRRIRKGAQP